MYCYFGCTRCLEPGFSGLERIHRILVWGCIVLLGVPSPFPVYRIFWIKQTTHPDNPKKLGELGFKTDVRAVLNQDFQASLRV